MKYKALSLLPLAAALAACAGGGVAEPHIPVSIPTATPLPTGEVTLSDDSVNIVNINTANTETHPPRRTRRSLYASPQNTSAGISIQQREVEKDYFGYKSKETSFIFQTPGGAQYALSSYSDPIVPSYSSPDFKIPDRHAGQRLADGSRIFICCSDSGATTYAEITKQDYMKFGAWIGPNGEIDLFAGGFPVGKTPKPAYSWGDDTPETAGKGKITYQVWGIRVKDGQFVTSSYTPPKGSSFTGYTNTPVLSFITANFNSNKLAGKIIGNSDYGPDVEIKEAQIDGLSFSGDATSGGKTGKLEGKFFGKFDSSYDRDTSIGGKITFDGDRSLDTVFGGVSYKKELENNTDMSTTHLTK
ncbi:TPA: hemoglobin-haptoglobin-utilization protein HupA [Neisseria meningitidis]|uniref:haemoglobin-haptoglobin-utilization protein HupA n=1 Tax=Neisseria meningitidis TaxID=487 RepID=UPI0007668BD9|nr:haemoglobin-haptoglobin-utilization protein HupA [Neisseria meningitidis]CWN28757.1 hemoglobin-haptoglobin-utilization protein [Neisseria meningitidis]CWO17690.1 hemoglobin-haptoglobin-utilization protein [Neisseria meningitidis]CWO55040.1 hemoglobin-haptoglobin-utilization protein [Neisseria meningitidis]CWO70330.1 hemoglobin-haptoglobin-utilization protein [Neisseria meningitidis]CWP06865.1 hemoglobin-haptoglobin-utilization protein [Neisseria meningitidis]